MKKLLTTLLLLINSILYAQCVDQIQEQGNNNAAVVTLNFYSSSGTLLGSCDCNLAGASGNLNCPTTCPYEVPGSGYGTVMMGDCIYGSDGVLIGILPIELTDFNCETKSDNIIIHWTTATELNNQEFQLWRSTDAINWIKITTKPGAGSSTTPHEYWFLDYFPPSNYYYYKLVQQDYNGVKTTSPITSCKFTQTNNSGTTITYYNILNQAVNINDAVTGFYIKEYTNGTYYRREVYYKQN